MKEIDLLTVAFASIIFLLIYFSWHSKFLFASFYRPHKVKHKPIIYNITIFLFALMSTYILALFEVLIGIASFWDGVFFGFLIWLGFGSVYSFFAFYSFKWNLKVYLLDNLLYLICLLITAGILAG